MSRLTLHRTVAIAAAFLVTFVVLLTPHINREQAVTQMACDYPTDAVLTWALDQGVAVHLQQDC